MRDHNLLSIAKAQPRTLEEIHRIRGIHAGELNRFGKEILDKVAEGIELARTQPVELPESGRRRADTEPEGLLKLLGAVLQIQAEQSKVSPSMLANGQELQDFLTGFRLGNLNGHPLLKGWRRDLAGEKLLAVLEGKVSLRVNPRDGSLILEDFEHSHDRESS
jgi:ribonuclease D